MKKILLHTCCGPCFLGSYEGLKNEDLEITNFYYNPNIQPVDEWNTRLENLKSAALGKSAAVLVSPYDPENYAEAVAGKESEFPRRCLDCYRLRLQKTAESARDGGYDLFSTTLLISPYQQHEALKNIGREVGQRVGIDFYYKDLRPFFKEGQAIAKNQNLYRQKYCGCLYSREYN
jgi:predicted adenine nucleotide alpha hydrolase (AANH) superfamily ATPase